jgi:hypothetical protein
MRERQKDRKTDRQTDRQTDGEYESGEGEVGMGWLARWTEGL